MVSWWWLLLAFWIGGALGLALGALAAVSRRAGADEPEEPEAREPWSDDRGGAPPHAGSGARRGGTVPRG
ncbi:hypothetical protein [Azohydromonas caseinilytica]|uniref:Uncharacterized protein n=1 Tax=Azohydromonas caseinilytica TaxID=2728836 RepID=A0A848FA44_9BURK|nr:hypothetical protein [Azohydromonas caseinilytica]NML15625.1 hypothetical protein [Azohydromonas caseinilytica]